MLKAVYKIYQADIQSGYEIFYERTKKHPIMFIWFFVLFLTAMWLISTVISLSLTQTGTVFIEFNLKWAYFGIFFIFFTLGALGTHFRLMRNSDITLVLASPVHHLSVMLGKMLTTFWLNLGIYLLGLCSILSVIEIFSMKQFINLDIFVVLTLLVIIGTLAGYLESILGSLQPFYRKIFFIWLGSFFLTSVWIGLDLPFKIQLVLFGFLIICASIEIFLSSAFFLEGWNSQTIVRMDFGKGGAQYLIRVLNKIPVSRNTKAIASKEFLFNARTRENLGSLLTIFGLVVAEIGVIQTLGPRHDLKISNAYLVYPIVNAMALYVGAILFCTVEGMTLLGKEAKSAWVLKSLPVTGANVMTGKGMSALLISFFLIIVAVPVPYIIYHNIYIVIFSIIGTLTLIFSYLGIGLWIGATSPNFTTSFRGTPDIITLYSTMMLCLVVGAVLLFPPLFLFKTNFILGIVSMIASAGIGILILILGTIMAGRSYDKLEINL